MFDQLKEILVDELQMRPDDVTPAAGRAALGLDSLAVVELSGLIGVRLGVEIFDYELLELGTVGEIAALLAVRRGAAARSADPIG